MASELRGRAASEYQALEEELARAKSDLGLVVGELEQVSAELEAKEQLLARVEAEVAAAAQRITVMEQQLGDGQVGAVWAGGRMLEGNMLRLEPPHIWGHNQGWHSAPCTAQGVDQLTSSPVDFRLDACVHVPTAQAELADIEGSLAEKRSQLDRVATMLLVGGRKGGQGGSREGVVQRC